MKYSTLFLDLDNTLLDFHKEEQMAIRKTLTEFKLPSDLKTVKLYSEINRSFWQSFERGEIPKNAIFEGRFKTLLSILNEKRDVESISQFYLKSLGEGYCKMDGADDVLTYLKAKGYKLYATTNGFAFTQYNRIEKSGLGKYFDKVFVSEDVGFQKPEKEYFETCILKIPEKDKAKILVIGDSQSSDILGGINSGLDTCWFNSDGDTPKYKSKYEINHLAELKNIL